LEELEIFYEKYKIFYKEEKEEMEKEMEKEKN
jgi:hypothetical protein